MRAQVPSSPTPPNRPVPRVNGNVEETGPKLQLEQRAYMCVAADQPHRGILLQVSKFSRRHPAHLRKHPRRLAASRCIRGPSIFDLGLSLSLSLSLSRRRCPREHQRMQLPGLRRGLGPSGGVLWSDQIAISGCSPTRKG